MRFKKLVLILATPGGVRWVASARVKATNGDSRCKTPLLTVCMYVRTWWSLRGGSEEQWCTRRHDRARKKRKLEQRQQQPLELVLQGLQGLANACSSPAVPSRPGVRGTERKVPFDHCSSQVAA